jgi:hypothetical protein
MSKIDPADPRPARREHCKNITGLPSSGIEQEGLRWNWVTAKRFCGGSRSVYSGRKYGGQRMPSPELLAADFVEFGRSGAVYGRQQIVEALREERPAVRTMSDFSVRWLADDVALVTYRSARRDSDRAEPVHSLRSSIWRTIDGRWQMVFHQGTPTSAD